MNLANLITIAAEAVRQGSPPPTSSHLACFIMCEMSVMVLKWKESEFNRIKYLNHLVLNGLVIITPNKIKFETLTPRRHEETAFKM